MNWNCYSSPKMAFILMQYLVGCSFNVISWGGVVEPINGGNDFLLVTPTPNTEFFRRMLTKHCHSLE